MRAERNQDEARKKFLPLSQHQQALRPDILVVRGGRGAGKTALFRFLASFEQNEKRSELLARFFGASEALEKSAWVVGFSETGINHPSPLILKELTQEIQNNTEKIRHFWFGQIVGVLGRFVFGESSEHWEKIAPFGDVWLNSPNSPQHWLDQIPQYIPKLLFFLDEIERLLAKEEKYLFLTYDDLDRIHIGDPAKQKEWIKILLEVWLSFANRYKHLRAKIFLREDLYQFVSRGFTDASKLESLSVSLRWSVEDLYRMLYRHFLASAPLCEWLAEQGFPVDLKWTEELGALPPPLPEASVSFPRYEREEISQLSWMTKMIGATMGSGVNKGYVYRWVVNHLCDAHRQIVPRSLLNLFSFAAQYALDTSPKAKGSCLLHSTELTAGLQKTSVHRVKELQEEYKFVQRLESLRGMKLFLRQEEIEQRLGKAELDFEDGYGEDGKRIFREMRELGIFRDRGEGEIDMPDIYRHAYDIKRRGGVKKPL
jgi:hypothetical protein